MFLDVFSLRRALVGGASWPVGYSSLVGRARQTVTASPPTGRDAVPSGSRVEALVGLLQTTPRDQVVEEVGRRIGEGATYQDVLAALLLAGTRDVQPRPTVGYQFHTVLAVISYHLISSQLPKRDRWLPIFWGIDYFKIAQASDAG